MTPTEKQIIAKEYTKECLQDDHFIDTLNNFILSLTDWDIGIEAVTYVERGEIKRTETRSYLDD